jgi:hypothetical protein
MDARAASRGGPLRVTSLNPVRDARTIGNEVGTSRAVLAARETALRSRFLKLVAEGESVTIAAAERPFRVSQLLAQLKWACDAIADDFALLEGARGGDDRRDRIMRETLDELTAMAELSSGRSFAASTWRGALDALHADIENLVVDGAVDAVVLVDIDLALERIERIERLATKAVRSYFGYISA